MDNETREMFHLILNKMDTMQDKIDTMQNDITTIKKDIIELKTDVKANYHELLELDKRTIDIQNKVSGVETVTARNCYDITLLKYKQA